MSDDESEARGLSRELRSTKAGKVEPVMNLGELNDFVHKIKNSVITMQNQQDDIKMSVDLLVRAQTGRLYDNPPETTTMPNLSPAVPLCTVSKTAQSNSQSGNAQELQSNSSTFLTAQTAFPNLHNASQNPVPNVSSTYSYMSQPISSSQVQLNGQQFGSDSYSMVFPQYLPHLMTPEHFLHEIKEFFYIHNTPQNAWLMMVSRAFPIDSDTSRWWRETKRTTTTWDQFSVSFLHYEKSSNSKDFLMTTLFNKRQKIDEAFESFAWDISSIFKKINPLVPLTEIVERILNSCLPEIAVYLRQSQYNSVAELNARARDVISDINKIRKFEKKSLFRARQSDPLIKADQDKNKPRTSWYQSQRNDNYKFSNPEPSNPQDSKPLDDNVPPTSTQTASINPKSKECLYCHKKGHVISECRKKAWVENAKSNKNPKN